MAAEQAAQEAQSQMIEDTEAWIETEKSIIENGFKEIGQTLENALTGGTSFDSLTTAMDRAVNIQEEYLTTTNKIYETNKLMNTAQKEIDKTSNTVAKKKLAQFVNETKQLQGQTKLSQYELQIQ
jgi:transcription initiation factor TFIIIB Brf1 subunit/transcription initiation factor TFIIB